MAILSELHVYPIKSCAGISLRRARLTAWGLEYDRSWMVTDAGGQFLTQRELPRLALVQVAIGASTLRISAPGMPVLQTPLTTAALTPAPSVLATIWEQAVPAFDTGADTAAWFSQFLQVPARLLRFDPAVARAADRRWSGDLLALTQFADGFPLLLIGQAALDELNTRLTRKGGRAIPMNRFRPNLVVADLPAHEEDYVATFTLHTPQGAVLLRPVKPCPRCPIPTIDQALGQPDALQPQEPLATLVSYRADRRLDGAPTFGQNLVVLAGIDSWLEVGQEISAELAFAD